MYVLDTDILIDVLRGHQPAVNWISDLREVPSIPGFVVMELIQNLCLTDNFWKSCLQRIIAFNF